MITRLGVATAALGLARKGALLLAGVAILLGLSSGRAPAPPGDARGPGTRGPLAARDEDGTLRLTLAVPEGRGYARCVVRDGTESS